ncbi:helix-turn-helix transcriptional regulator [Roseococcus sp. SDR]|uniref:helix-turn-helix domain-containing protein n=1 Tax=Roseococcus sp. SDR TaxID=2835532 RepID=UPI001BCDB3FE|nr:helix-turn-helix transcriptional regulator [Roseococcus sp. SDR]MBS7789257.1 helix-turn-helix transcriptional regulator [Roseococcus sp. SDR]MBV1844571.1 helix-turn-helix transcriptional regulator [Roseococcus sp. SDR]
MSAPLLDGMDVFKRLRAACEAAGGQGAWAERHGMSAAYVSEVLNAKREPGPAVLNALGLKRVVKFAEVRRVNG